MLQYYRGGYNIIIGLIFFLEVGGGGMVSYKVGVFVMQKQIKRKLTNNNNNNNKFIVIILGLREHLPELLAKKLNVREKNLRINMTLKMLKEKRT